MRVIALGTALGLALGLAAACAGNPAPETAAAARHLTLASVARGRLTSADPRLPGTQRAAHTWAVEGQAGQRVVIEMNGASSNLDPHLILQDSTGKELARDDDGGPGTNARLRYVFRTTGRYRVVANNFRAGRHGAYTISLNELGPLATNMLGVRGTVGRSETRHAEFTRGDATETRITGMRVSMDQRGRVSNTSVTSQDVEYHVWLFNAAAGDSVVLELRGPGIDPLLILQEADGHELARNAGNHATARIGFTFPYGGTFRIVATTGNAPRYGAYILAVK